MIAISGLVKSFGGRRVLAGIDAEIPEGRIVALMGASGSGKSTLLRCLNGLETFDAGRIEIADFKLAAGAHEPALLQGLRCSVGMVFQDFQLFPHLSVLQNVTLAPRLVRARSVADANAEASSLLAAVGLSDRGDARPHQLSGGQSQRVAIARALAQGSRVLLLDEPTSALDPELREEVREVLRGVARGVHATPAGGEPSRRTFVLVTHELRLARELADELWLLHQGRIVERGAPSEVLARPATDVGRDFMARALS
ncbi:MAG TPA: amino acid ABC transporter ATP-binding protein [Polyangiaceae bacterium]|jgi:ABC-type polar amino acid transport system ATPase subunit